MTPKKFYNLEATLSYIFFLMSLYLFTLSGIQVATVYHLNDTRHSDTQHNDTQHKDTQHNNKNAILIYCHAA
jgi:hypothetical protein